MFPPCAGDPSCPCGPKQAGFFRLFQTPEARLRKKALFPAGSLLLLAQQLFTSPPVGRRPTTAYEEGRGTKGPRNGIFCPFSTQISAPARPLPPASICPWLFSPLLADIARKVVMEGRENTNNLFLAVCTFPVDEVPKGGGETRLTWRA